MKQLGQKILVFVVGSLIVEGICYAVGNIIGGLDTTGNEPDPTKTRVKKDGTIYLGTDDYLVE